MDTQQRMTAQDVALKFLGSACQRYATDTPKGRERIYNGATITMIAA